MRQVFQSRPWVHQEEPEALAEVFRLYGVRRRVPKGYVFLHGSERGEVNYLVKGIAFFAFVDSDGRDRIFAVLPPKRVIGDLDALTEYRLNVIAVTSRPCEVLTVPGEVYRKFLRSDPKLMELYAVSAVTKEESHMEGLFANYTLPLEQRLLALASAVISTYYPLKHDGWNPLPIELTTFEIAAITAANRSSVSTVIAGWIQKGLAKREGRLIILHGKLFEREYDWERDILAARRSRSPDKELFP
ncbi:MAG: Crp/Fnr family transcriptional regulator [Burkholderia sp.]|jgi:CRP-like cAMP-binding protein